MKRTPLKRKPLRLLGTAEQRYAFRKAVHAADWGCVMRDFSRCDGPLDCAHVIPKQRLKKMGFGAGVVYSVDAAFLLCRRHHTRHDNHHERVPDSLIPERCRRFAVQYGRPAA